MSILAGIAGSLFGKGISSLFGGDSASDMVQGVKDDAGIRSAVQGANPTPSGQLASKTETNPTTLRTVFDDMKNGLLKGTVDSATQAILGGVDRKFSGGMSRAGRNTQEYLANAFPELNPWERAGAGASGVGASSQSVDPAIKLKKMEFQNAQTIVDKNNATELAKAKIASDTSILNNQHSMAPQYKKLDSELALLQANASKVMADESKSQQEKKNLMAQEVKTWAETNNIRLTAGQINATVDSLYFNMLNSATTNSMAGKLATDVGRIFAGNNDIRNTPLGPAVSHFTKYYDALGSQDNFNSKSKGLPVKSGKDSNSTVPWFPKF